MRPSIAMLTMIGFLAEGCGSNENTSLPAASSKGAGGAAGRASAGGSPNATGGSASDAGGVTPASNGAATASGGAASGGTSDSSGGASGSSGGVAPGGAASSSGGTASGGAASSSGGAAGSTNGGAYADVKAKIDAYKAAHPGNGGKDWDINAKTPAEIAADPAAAELLSLCGKEQRPVIPLLSWEYGGNDHQWINPSASALVYCVYIPVSPATDHFSYDAAADHVTADVYVLCPGENPCKDRVGAQQVLDCLGDATNVEILVDVASFNDGMDAGLSLSMASTELRLVEPDGTRVHLADNT